MVTETDSEKCQNRASTRTRAFVTAVVIALLLTTFLAGSYLVYQRRQNILVIDDKINPNNVPLASLLRLPGIGAKKAQAIIDYRSGFNGRYAFENSSDLQNISGIGPKTVEKISPWLYFGPAEELTVKKKSENQKDY